MKSHSTLFQYTIDKILNALWKTICMDILAEQVREGGGKKSEMY